MAKVMVNLEAISSVPGETQNPILNTYFGVRCWEQGYFGIVGHNQRLFH